MKKEYFTEDYIVYFTEALKMDAELLADAEKLIETAQTYKSRETDPGDLARISIIESNTRETAGEIRKDIETLDTEFTRRFTLAVSETVVNQISGNAFKGSDKDLENIVLSDFQVKKALDLAHQLRPQLESMLVEWVHSQAAQAFKDMPTLYTKKDRKASNLISHPNDLLTRTVFSKDLAKLRQVVINPGKNKKDVPKPEADNVIVQLMDLDEYIPYELQPYFNAVCTLWDNEERRQGRKISEITVNDNDIKRAMTGNPKAIAKPNEKSEIYKNILGLRRPVQIRVRDDNEGLKEFYGITLTNKKDFFITYTEADEITIETTDGLKITGHRYTIKAKPYLLKLAQDQGALIRVTDKALLRGKGTKSNEYYQIRDYLLSTVKGMQCGSIRHTILLSTLYERQGIDNSDTSARARQRRQHLRSVTKEVLNNFKESKLIKSYNFEKDPKNKKQDRAIKIRLYGKKSKQKKTGRP